MDSETVLESRNRLEQNLMTNHFQHQKIRFLHPLDGSLSIGQPLLVRIPRCLVPRRSGQCFLFVLVKRFFSTPQIFRALRAILTKFNRFRSKIPIFSPPQANFLIFYVSKTICPSKFDDFSRKPKTFPKIFSKKRVKIFSPKRNFLKMFSFQTKKTLLCAISFFFDANTHRNTGLRCIRDIKEHNSYYLI